MRSLLKSERGSALTVAILLMSIIMVAGLATFAMADNQHAQSRVERVRESSFNLAEAAASGQVFQLSRDWPGSPGQAYPASCNKDSVGRGCPDPNNLASSFSSVDYGSDTTWTTSVRDNGGDAGIFYSDAVTTGQPAYDASGPDGRADGKVWVRSEAVVRGKSRKIVTLVKAGEVSRPFPRNTVTAGWLDIVPNAPKIMVDTNGVADNYEPGDVAVRCNMPAPSPTCLGYEPGRGQIAPDTSQTGFPPDPAMPPQALEELRALARASGTYYATGCPPSLTGRLVFIENADCAYAGSGNYNSPTEPGMVVVGRGTLSLSGSRKFYGLVYAANLQNSSGVVVEIAGTAEIHGSLAVDSGGGVRLGSSGVTLFYDPSVFSLPLGYGNASAVQGTWREVY